MMFGIDDAVWLKYHIFKNTSFRANFPFNTTFQNESILLYTTKSPFHTSQMFLLTTLASSLRQWCLSIKCSLFLFLDFSRLASDWLPLTSRRSEQQMEGTQNAMPAFRIISSLTANRKRSRKEVWNAVFGAVCSTFFTWIWQKIRKNIIGLL